MHFATGTAFALALAAVPYAVVLAAPTSAPVCIVGAGPSGLTVAHGLEVKGIDAVIFEKAAAAGGKCTAYYDEKGLFHPLGALLFANETYANTLPLIDASGVLATPFTYSFKNWLYEWHTGHVEEQKESIKATTDRAIFRAQLNKYVDFWNKEFKPTVSIGYKLPIQERFMDATLTFLIKNGMPLISVLMIEGTVPYGYGSILEVPAIYMLQYFTPDIMLFFAGQREGYVIDFAAVFVQYAKTLQKTPQYYNTHITKIDRSGAFPTISYTVAGGDANAQPRVQTCSKIVLAFPPILPALEKANLDITDAERSVFAPVSIIKYMSGAVRVLTPDQFLFAGFLRELTIGKIANKVNEWFNSVIPGAHLPTEIGYIPFSPKPEGQPTAFVRVHNASDIATTWSWGPRGSAITLEDGRTLLKQALSKINKDPRDSNAKPKPVTDADVMAFKEHDYFPHYDNKADLRTKYLEFNRLQGKKNTYYVSGFNGFETVEFAIRAGKDIVQSYF
ncbi:FAD/NAD-P-binding domain-containing protein [Geranomyces variabilis]|nr:FAD/NAD-P-binding domain-containing protein [Geranomyces variabilis]KAJ3142159.1 hypothetical protein HDU90_004432 [Geranomyces variabilis]